MSRDLTGGFTPDQMRRYSRHVLLPDLGGRGQARLLASTVRISVDGAAGRIAAAYLAASGVGTILLSGDPTRAVTSSAFPFARPDLGQPTGPALLARLAILNPDAHIAWCQPPDLRTADTRNTAGIEPVSSERRMADTRTESPGVEPGAEDRVADTRGASDGRVADTVVVIEADMDELPLDQAMARGGEVAARVVWRLAVGS